MKIIKSSLKITSILLLILTSGCPDDPSAPPAMLPIIAKAIEIAKTGQSPLLTANDPAWSFATSFLNAYNQFAPILPDLGNKTTLEECASSAASQLLKKTVASIQRITPGFATGLSGNAVFRLMAPSSNTPFSIVKSFIDTPSSNNSFAREIDGIAIVNGLQIPSAKAITIQALAKCTVGNEHYNILVESFSPGELMYDIVNSLSNLPSNNSSHDALFTKANDSMKALGSLLAKFHREEYAVRNYLNPTTETELANIFGRAINNLQKVPALKSDIDFDRLKNTFKQRLNTLKTARLVYGINHGDAHLGNFLYDSATKTITTIDLDRVGYSVTAQSEPLGLPAVDFLRVIRSVTLATLRNPPLPAGEARDLEQAFTQTYLANGGSLPTPEERAVLELYMIIAHVQPKSDPVPRELFITYTCQNFRLPGPPQGACMTP